MQGHPRLQDVGFLYADGVCSLLRLGVFRTLITKLNRAAATARFEMMRASPKQPGHFRLTEPLPCCSSAYARGRLNG